jgi:hypothetical protein
MVLVELFMGEARASGDSTRNALAAGAFALKSWKARPTSSGFTPAPGSAGREGGVRGASLGPKHP